MTPEQPAPTPARKPYPYGVHSVVVGMFALAVYPIAIVLGPLALISGFIGYRAASRTNRLNVSTWH